MRPVNMGLSPLPVFGGVITSVSREMEWGLETVFSAVLPGAKIKLACPAGAGGGGWGSVLNGRVGESLGFGHLGAGVSARAH